jgi:undecaprenyl diphosphate synthase
VNPHTEVQPAGLDHVVLAGGTPSEWLDMTREQWSARLADIAKGARAGGAHWVTVLPHHGEELDHDELSQFTNILISAGCVMAGNGLDAPRFISNMSNGLQIIIDPRADGHQRFAATVESLRQSGVNRDAVDEDLMTAAILSPANTDVDLVVILGPANRIPESMVWELAYSELVFLDMSWSLLAATHLELAIDDFNRRHRRFGGLDS